MCSHSASSSATSEWGKDLGYALRAERRLWVSGYLARRRTWNLASVCLWVGCEGSGEF